MITNNSFQNSFKQRKYKENSLNNLLKTNSNNLNNNFNSNSPSNSNNSNLQLNLKDLKEQQQNKEEEKDKDIKDNNLIYNNEIKIKKLNSKDNFNIMKYNIQNNNQNNIQNKNNNSDSDTDSTESDNELNEINNNIKNNINNNININNMNNMNENENEKIITPRVSLSNRQNLQPELIREIRQGRDTPGYFYSYSHFFLILIQFSHFISFFLYFIEANNLLVQLICSQKELKVANWNDVLKAIQSNPDGN